MNHHFVIGGTGDYHYIGSWHPGERPDFEAWFAQQGFTIYTLGW